MGKQAVCPLCSSERISLYLETKDFFLSKEPYDLYGCSDCGFIFTHNPPDENHIGRYYESDTYISHDDSVKSIYNTLYKSARSFMLRKKRRTVNKLTGLRTGSILDIGSGTGHFLLEMRRSGWEVKGVEINEKPRQFSISKFQLDVILPEHLSSIPDSTFDCITLWHVLEHFHHPFQYASEIRRLMKPGGTCMIALPNCSSSDALHYKKYWAAYDVPRHLWHFNAGTFRLFSEKTGFTMTGMKSLPFDVFYISSESEKFKGTAFSFLTGMVKGTWFSVKAFFRKEKASSLMYFLKKTEI